MNDYNLGDGSLNRDFYRDKSMWVASERVYIGVKDWVSGNTVIWFIALTALFLLLSLLTGRKG